MSEHSVINVGDFVQAKVPDSQRANRTAYGMVAAIEKYTDFAATNVYVYVRWFEPDGEPADQTKRHFADELEVMEAATR